MNTHCCQQMSDQLSHNCGESPQPHDCPDKLISYSPKFREYGLVVHDGGTSSVQISFCPWCGRRLPSSLRSQWFEELEALGFDSPVEQEIPDKYKSEAWHAGA
jgi:hypothetical protein